MKQTNHTLPDWFERSQYMMKVTQLTNPFSGEAYELKRSGNIYV